MSLPLPDLDGLIRVRRVSDSTCLLVSQQTAIKANLPKIDEKSLRLAEATLLNKKLRRKAPPGWDSAKVIREWRLKR